MWVFILCASFLSRVQLHSLGKPGARCPRTTSSSQNYSQCHHARKFQLGFVFVFLNSFLCGPYYYTDVCIHALWIFFSLRESQGQEMGLIVTLVMVSSDLSLSNQAFLSFSHRITFYNQKVAILSFFFSPVPLSVDLWWKCKSILASPVTRRKSTISPAFKPQPWRFILIHHDDCTAASRDWDFLVTDTAFSLPLPNLAHFG